MNKFVWASKKVVPVVSLFVSISLYATTWSVDQQLGDDTAAAADATGNTPFLHIQKAIDKAASGDTIVVGDGVYGPDTEGVQSTTLNSSAVCSTLAIKSKYLFIRSRNGARTTIIKGRFHSDSDKIGSDGARCLFTYKPAGKIVVEGFTLRDGATNGDANYGGRGGAVHAYKTSGAGASEETFLINCVIENCYSTQQGAVHNSVLIGCVVKDCTTVSGGGASGIYSGAAYFTVFAGNVANDAVADRSNVYCCTFYGNTRNTDARGQSATVKAQASDCIVTAELATYIETANMVVDKTGASMNAPAAGDYRPIAGGTADIAAVLTLPNDLLPAGYTWSSVKDAAGNAINPAALRVGAVQVAAGKVSISAANGGLTVVGAEIGTPLTLGPGDEVVITPSGVATRPCAGVTVGGETLLFDDLPESTYTITYEQLYATGRTGISVEAYYTNVWHLSPTGDDTASGFTAKTAKKNFSAVFGTTAEGDVVQLAEGHYDYGDVMASGSNRARVVVPKNRTVQGAGAGKSFIHGVVDDSPQADDGCGANAAICVYLLSGARVRGFTLTDGRSLASGLGGGVKAADRPTTAVEMCIITNCVASRGGGAHGVRLINCLVTGCRGTERAGGTYYCEHYNTVVVGNTSSYEAVMYPYVLANSTVGGNTLSGSSVADVFVGALTGGAEFTMTNSLVVGTIMSQPSITIGPLVNNYVAAVGTGAIAERASEFAVRGIDELQVDAQTGRPLVGKNAAIGQGDYSKYDRSLCGDTDLYGLPRVINGTLDVGALDADYRPVFLKDIGMKRGEITAITSGVLHDAENDRISLGDGDGMTLLWGHKISGWCSMSFTVPSGGAYTVRLNGETVEPVDSQYSFQASAESTDILEVAYSGPDGASFRVNDAKSGLSLIFR